MSGYPTTIPRAAAVWYLGRNGGTGASASSLVVLEALACETPVVRSDDTDEEAVDGLTGYLVDPTDAEQVKDVTLGLLRDGALAREMGRRGREGVQMVYSWDLVVDRIPGAPEDAGASRIGRS